MPPILGARDILAEARRTLPIGIELYRGYHYVVPLGKKRRLSLIVLKLHCPDELEFKLDQWRSEMANRLDMATILVRRVKGEQNIRSNLINEFKGVTLLDFGARSRINAMLDSLCGTPPEFRLADMTPTEVEAQSRRTSRTSREDLTSIPFIAIDRAETRDIEDLIHAERKANGALIWRTAYISAIDYVTPGSPIDKYALRVASTIYGRSRAITTLGAALSHDAVSFLPGEIRPAWIVEGSLIPLSSAERSANQSHPLYELRYKIRYANVVNHKSIEPANPLASGSDPSIYRSMSALAEVARVLQHRRSARPSLVRVDGEGATERILAEIMIESKRILSEFLGENQQYPMIYRVHQKPSADVIQIFHDQLEELGIPHNASDFDHPSQFAGILQSLESRRDARSQSLLNNLLDTFLLRTLYSTENYGHYGLRVDEYAEFKPRDASGLANQYQLAAIFEHRPALSRQEMTNRANLLNEKRWRRDERSFRLIFLEMLHEKLGLTGTVCLGSVAEIKRGVIYIEVQGFSKWGILISDRGVDLEPGDPVAAELQGFDLNSMRFVFAVIGDQEG